MMFVSLLPNSSQCGGARVGLVEKVEKPTACFSGSIVLVIIGSRALPDLLRILFLEKRVLHYLHSAQGVKPLDDVLFNTAEPRMIKEV